jgi:glutamate racemase
VTSVREYDLVFADTCVGGATVVARAGATARGLRAYFLADYAVNPLGTRSRPEVHQALERWIDVAARRAGTLVVACNTASVLLEQAGELAETAAAAGLRVRSMVHLLDRALAAGPAVVRGKRVCLMGTRFTVSQPAYPERLFRAGAADVRLLAATETERTIAHLLHTSPEGRRRIEDEAGPAVRDVDVVVLGCTLFPLVSNVLRDLNPRCVLLDPASGIDDLLQPGGAGPNRLAIELTGETIGPDEVQSRAEDLFPGWIVESVQRGGRARPCSSSRTIRSSPVTSQ